MPLSYMGDYIAETPEELALYQAVKNNNIVDTEYYLLRFQNSRQLEKFQGDFRGPLEAGPRGKIPGVPIMCIAADNNNTIMVEILLNYGFKADVGDYNYPRPLFKAIDNKNVAMVKNLISHLTKEELENANYMGRNVLYFLIIKKLPKDLIDDLIYNKAVKIEYQSALEAIIKVNDLKLFKEFFFKIPDNLFVDKSCLLSLAIVTDQNIEIIDILSDDQKVQFYSNQQYYFGATTDIAMSCPLKSAAQEGTRQIIELLWKKRNIQKFAKDDVQKQNNKLFEIAVAYGNLEVANFLKIFASNGLDVSNLYTNFLKFMYKILEQYKKSIEDKTGIEYKHKILNIKNLEEWSLLLSSHDNKEKIHTENDIEKLSSYEHDLFPNLKVDVDITGVFSPSEIYHRY